MGRHEKNRRSRYQISFQPDDKRNVIGLSNGKFTQKSFNLLNHLTNFEKGSECQTEAKEDITINNYPNIAQSSYSFSFPKSLFPNPNRKDLHDEDGVYNLFIEDLLGK